MYIPRKWLLITAALTLLYFFVAGLQNGEIEVKRDHTSKDIGKVTFSLKSE
ncbi:hypothetical protein ZA09F31_22810 [Escherichia coli]